MSLEIGQIRFYRGKLVEVVQVVQGNDSTVRVVFYRYKTRVYKLDGESIAHFITAPVQNALM